MPELTQRVEPPVAAAAAPAPAPGGPPGETPDQGLARLRANAAASLVPSTPPEDEQVAALSSMVQNLFVAERAHNNDVHIQQANEYERGLKMQSDLTALREAQLSRANSIGTSATRTKVIAAQLDAVETSLYHLTRALDELAKRLVGVPVQPEGPSGSFWGPLLPVISCLLFFCQLRHIRGGDHQN